VASETIVKAAEAAYPSRPIALPPTPSKLREQNRASVLPAAIITFVFAAYPPIQAALLGGTAAITTFFAADAFYYLSIAANSTFGLYTFDGRAMTNGFHPLWQVLLQLVVGHLTVQSGLPPIIASFALSIVVASIGLAYIAAALAFATDNIWPALLLFPGAFYLLSSQIDPRFGSVWSFMNGMESPCSIFFFGLLFYFCIKSRLQFTSLGLLVLSLLSLGVVFSRLDDIFLPVSFGVWFFLRKRKSVILYGIPIFLGLSAYLIFNRLSVGTFLPTSGAVKARGLGLVQNLAWAVYISAPFTSATLYRLVPKLRHAGGGLPVDYRLAQTLIPMLIAALLLTYRRLLSWITGEYKSLFVVLFSYVLLKGSYNLFFVPWGAQGHWYYAVSILITDLTVCLAVFRAIGHYPLRKGIMMTTLLLAAWFSSVTQIWRVLDPKYQNTINIQMLARGQEIRSALSQKVERPRIIEFDDGILNYSLSTPTLSGFGLASDPASARALRAKRLLLYASSSGYNVIASANYPMNVAEGMSSDQLRENLHHWFLITESDLADFDYKVVYIDPITHAFFVEFSPKPGK
jgi:hypothetical protein